MYPSNFSIYVVILSDKYIYIYIYIYTYTHFIYTYIYHIYIYTSYISNIPYIVFGHLSFFTQKYTVTILAMFLPLF